MHYSLPELVDTEVNGGKGEFWEKGGFCLLCLEPSKFKLPWMTSMVIFGVFSLASLARGLMMAVLT